MPRRMNADDACVATSDPGRRLATGALSQSRRGHFIAKASLGSTIRRIGRDRSVGRAAVGALKVARPVARARKRAPADRAAPTYRVAAGRARGSLRATRRRGSVRAVLAALVVPGGIAIAARGALIGSRGNCCAASRVGLARGALRAGRWTGPRRPRAARCALKVSGKIARTRGRTTSRRAATASRSGCTRHSLGAASPRSAGGGRRRRADLGHTLAVSDGVMRANGFSIAADFTHVWNGKVAVGGDGRRAARWRAATCRAATRCAWAAGSAAAIWCARATGGARRGRCALRGLAPRSARVICDGRGGARGLWLDGSGASCGERGAAGEVDDGLKEGLQRVHRVRRLKHVTCPCASARGSWAIRPCQAEMRKRPACFRYRSPIADD
jgi:hypothetical protein